MMLDRTDTKQNPSYAPQAKLERLLEPTTVCRKRAVRHSSWKKVALVVI